MLFGSFGLLSSLSQGVLASPPPLIVDFSDIITPFFEADVQISSARIMQSSQRW
jgi:hypothetical protein